MIVLDTNVVSEVMKAQAEPRVLNWFRVQDTQDLAVTPITLAEINIGLARMPESRRRFNLQARLHAFVSRGLGSRVFGFDTAAATVYGDVVVARERSGRPLAGFDGLIAEIVRARGAVIATRNVSDFSNCGVPVVNPWDGPDPGHRHPE